MCWSSTYLLISRILKVRKALTDALQEMEWDNLATSEWRFLESILDLLHPLAQYTFLISGEYTTLFSVVPALMELDLHLAEIKSRWGLVGAVTLLQTKLGRQFDRFLSLKQMTKTLGNFVPVCYGNPDPKPQPHQKCPHPSTTDLNQQTECTFPWMLMLASINL